MDGFTELSVRLALLSTKVVLSANKVVINHLEKELSNT